ncbi:hypothetical protein L2E82_30701 [Cichorium intybus]|uniref:Uncharacterized protein n=1 Tax=Cichorium intybus TaxID=13427 RepID=A0ACB9D1A0_CICIN|nr:hypothetical protein L2E82_30701 [Cichorium intybus]
MCEFVIPGAQNTAVLVVGATSSVGRIVVHKLMIMGYSVKALVRNADEEVVAMLPTSVKIVIGDVRDPTTLRVAVEGCSKIIYCATARSSITVDLNRVVIIRAYTTSAKTSRTTTCEYLRCTPVALTSRSSCYSWIQLLLPSEVLGTKLWSCCGSGDCVFFGCAIGLLLFLDSVALTFRSSWYFFTKCMKFSGVRRVLAVLSLGVFSLADSSHSVAFFAPLVLFSWLLRNIGILDDSTPCSFFWNLAFSGGLVADWFFDLMFQVDSGSVIVLLQLP